VRVLIAEDEALIRMDLREMVESEGHEVVGEAKDGEEAVALARSLEPDLVFMDVKMPGMDGLEAARVITGERIAPIVMVTAFSQQTYVDEASEAGALAYLVKPFSPRDIVPAMSVASARFEQMRALEDEVSGLEERLETRKLVERAKGILIDKGLSEAEAFARLQKLAMDRRMSLKEVAEAVLLASEA
jgi:AmiR/NasT family two-component response regulator